MITPSTQTNQDKRKSEQFSAIFNSNAFKINFEMNAHKCQKMDYDGNREKMEWQRKKFPMSRFQSSNFNHFECCDI